MRKVIILSFIVSFILPLAGCSFLAHYNELMVLKRFAENRREIELYLDNQEREFYKLRADIENNRLAKGLTEQNIGSRYGDPIFCKNAMVRDDIGQTCLYRHPTEYFSSDKVYLDFDKDARLRSWVLEKADK
jgi:hypothetical protein